MKMRKVFTIMAVAAMVAGLASCSKSDCENENDGTPCYLTVSDVVMKEYVPTRSATEKNSFDDGDVLSVWVRESDNDSYNGNYYSNLKLSNDRSSWRVDPTVELTSTLARVYAFYPQQAEITEMTISMDENNDYDYMYDVVDGVNRNNPNISLTMKHVRAKLVIDFLTDQNTVSGVPTGVEIRSDALRISGAFNLLNESYVYDEGDVTRIVLNGQTNDREWFILPTPESVEASQINFSVTIDANTYTATTTNTYKFEAGKIYTFHLKIENSSKSMTIDGVDVQEWSNVGGEIVTLTN